MKANSLRTGFTLMEILLVIGIIAILAAIVIAAVNPTKQLDDARGSARHSATREIDNAISQYIIDGNSLTGIPSTIATAQNICAGTATGAACTGAGGYDLDALTPDYLVDIPVDPTQTGSTFSGYRIYLNGSFIEVCSPVLDATCGT